MENTRTRTKLFLSKLKKSKTLHVGAEMKTLKVFLTECLAMLLSFLQKSKNQIFGKGL